MAATFGLPPQGTAPLAEPPAGGSANPTALLFSKIWWLFFNAIASGLGLALNLSMSGTHAQRLASSAASFAQGSLWDEIDRGAIYQVRLVAGASTWVYAWGISAATQATLPADLGANDAGFLVQVTDYGHMLLWSGTAWGWAPGDEGSGRMVVFEVDPTGVGWHLYDGTAAVPYLNAIGTLGTITLPDLTSTTAKGSFVEAGSPNAGPTAAVSPTITATGANTASATTGITNPADTGATTPGPTGAPQGTPATIAVGSGSATTVAAMAHTHTDATSHLHTIAAPTDPGHVHALTAITVTVTAGGTPQSITRRPWFRQ